MIFIKSKSVDKTLLRISKSIDGALESVYSEIKSLAKKEDTGKDAEEVEFPISLEDCLYVYDNSYIVAKVARILAQDLLLGDINLVAVDEKDKEKVEDIQKNLKDFQEELYFAGIDYFYAPMGVFEIAYDKEVSDKFRLSQIPIRTVKLLQLKLEDNKYYLIKQETDEGINYFKISGEEYPENFTYNNKELGKCVVFGGDNFYKFFKKPEWLQAKKALFADINIDAKYEKQLENGNLADAILHVNLEPKIGTNQLVVKTNSKGEALTDDDGNPIMELAPDEEDVIDEELEDKEGGIAVVYTRSEKPRSFELVNLEANNNKELDKMEERAEYKVLFSYSVPKIRLGVMDEKQSMNSTRDQTVWEIYTKDLGTFQKPFKRQIKTFLQELYDIPLKVKISTPIFSDKREIETNLLHKAWEKGALTLKQYIVGLSEYLTVIKLEEYDFELNTGVWNSRYYNGQPFGDFELSESELEEFNKISNLISDLQ